MDSEDGTMTSKLNREAWLHSMHSSPLNSQVTENKTPEDAASLASSSGSSSLPDQGYAPSEEMAEGEDSGTVSSPSDTQPTSPEGSLSPGLLGPVRDNSSDSDEGYAMWRSRHSQRDGTSKSRARVETGSYKEDPELTAQLHRTLADFEADLAEHADLASLKETRHDVCVLSVGRSEVPVSVVDMDVPVTAIDEVFVDDSCTNTPEHMSEIQKSGVWSEVAETKVFSLQSSVEPQNKNHACVTGDAKSSSEPPPSQTECRLWSQEDVTKRNQQGWETLVAAEVSGEGRKSKEIELRTPSQANSSVDFQRHSESKAHLCESAVQSSQEKKPVILPSSQRTLSAGHDNQVHQNSPSTPLSPHGAITHSVTSRFGMKTFTVVPPRPAVSCDSAEVLTHAATVAAVKIDDQGNMVRAGIGHNRFEAPRAESVDRTTGFGKAREFWSSSKKQEGHSRGVIERDVPLRSLSAVKIDDQSNRLRAGIGYRRAETLQVESGDGSPPFGRAREFWSSSEKQEGQSIGLVQRDVPVRSPSTAAVKAPPLGSRPDDKTGEQNIRRTENEMLKNFGVDRNERPEEPRKDLTFLKPSRRTSSHYVASAINKHSNTNTSSRPGYATQKSYSSVTSSQLTTSHRPGRAATVNPNPSAASLTVSRNKQGESFLVSAHSAAPSRSLSYPEVHRSDSRSEAVEVQPLRERFGGGRGSSGGISKMLESARNRHLQSSWVDRVSTTAAANGDRDALKLSPPLNPKPQLSSPPPPKETSPGPTINKRDSIQANVLVTTDTKQEASATVTDGGGVTPEALPASVFGPVRKFRPVVCKSVEKETSLHSSLMEAIQSGRGRDGLKSTSPGSSSVKKVSYVEEENERSALLAAIRAQSNSSRLRKTKSEAAAELQRFRTDSEGQEPLFSPSPLSPPPVFSPPPPPPLAPMSAPPPPPPLLLTQSKPSATPVNATTNPAMAREAMLEAIRSGAAAERLKKVAVPTKTVTVNGRTGTMRTTSVLHQ